MSQILDTAMARVKDIAEHFKEELEEERFIGNVQWYEGENNRAIMFPELTDENDGRAELGWAARVLSSTMPEFTSIVAVNDSYTASSPTKVDGSNWQHGDMSHAFQNKTQDAAFVRECLTYLVVEAEAVCMISLPYERSQGKVFYDWDHVQTISTEDEDGTSILGGELADALRSAFEVKKITSVMEEEGISGDDFGISPAIVKVSMLCAGVKLIMNGTDNRYRVMIAAHTDEERRYIKDSFSEPGFGVLDASTGEQL